ncbi:MAG: hypothetical protein J6T54_05720 [Fibrobacter sp.]|nr:hypothetical protein [Fibrobacter sp.]
MKIFNALALSILLALLAACGDESSSSAPDPIGEISSSSNDDNGSASSSSQKDSKKSSSSVAEKNSSSSVSGKNSSSSVVESSSSEEEFRVCDDGDTLSSDEASGVYYYICKDGWWALDHVLNRDSLDSLAAIEKNKEHPNMDSLFAGYNGKYFEFEDPRDGRKYKYLKFEGRSEDFDAFTTFYVMAENLNYGKMIPSGTTKFDDSVTEKLCYVDDVWFCDNHFGGLYTWAEAMNLPKVCDSVAVDSNDACKAITKERSSIPGEGYLNAIWQGICPDGWHIMNQREWRYANGDIRSKILWEENAGRNSDGLAIIPSGVWIYGDGFSGVRNRIDLWMPNESNSKKARVLYMSSVSYTFESDMYSNEKQVFSSVRCVMDEDNPLAKN